MKYTYTEKRWLRERLQLAAKACLGKGAGQERQLFEWLQMEYRDATGNDLTEAEARCNKN